MLLKTLMRMHFITPYHIIHVTIYAFVISYFVLMHIRWSEGITLLDFNEEEEEQTLEDLPECPDHRPTSFLKGKPRAF